MAATRAFGLIIVGDELLSGKRSDQHFAAVVKMLAIRRLELAWAEIVGDDEARLTASLRRSMASDDIVFSCGGIGATPDDRTRQCAAVACGKSLVAQPEALAEIVGRYGDDAYPHRIRMAEFPEGARVIPNPVNRIAGFSMDDHHFVPGFPKMAWPMLEWVLDNHYADLSPSEPTVERTLRVFNVAESELISIIESVMSGHPQARLSCLPTMGDRAADRHVELGVRAPASVVTAAFDQLIDELRGDGIEPVLSSD